MIVKEINVLATPRSRFQTYYVNDGNVAVYNAPTSTVGPPTVDIKDEVKYVTVLPTIGETGILYINATDNNVWYYTSNQWFCVGTGDVGVSKITAGSGVSISPTTGKGDVTVTNSGVTKLTAGSNVTISPTTGMGNVTISATGGGTGTVTNVTGTTPVTVTSNTTTPVISVKTATTTDLGVVKPDGTTITINNGTISNAGVTKITAGTNVTISPTTGMGNVTISATGGGGGGVTKLIAGTNISLSPAGGTGEVTINATGGGGGGGSVTSIATSNPITGGTITTTGTLSLNYDNATLKTDSSNSNKLEVNTIPVAVDMNLGTSDVWTLQNLHPVCGNILIPTTIPAGAVWHYQFGNNCTTGNSFGWNVTPFAFQITEKTQFYISGVYDYLNENNQARIGMYFKNNDTVTTSYGGISFSFFTTLNIQNLFLS